MHDALVWREHEDGSFALKVLKAGRLAAEAQVTMEGPAERSALAGDAAEPEVQTGFAADASAAMPRSSRRARSPAPAASVLPIAVAQAVAPTGSKRERVMALLRRPEGAAMAELIDETGWLPHTTRAALSGLRKSGVMLERFRDEELTTRYRIVDGGTTADDRSAAGTSDDAVA